MLVFAWILWSIYILIFLVYALVVVVGILALGNGKQVTLKINILEVLINVAVFVFLNIYIFSH